LLLPGRQQFVEAVGDAAAGIAFDDHKLAQREGTLAVLPGQILGNSACRPDHHASPAFALSGRPCESHAWIEAAGRPVGEPALPDRPFRVTVRI
jgi:hypothetical protein